MTVKKDTRPKSLAELLADPALPRWANTYRLLDLAAAVADGDSEALSQHAAAWVCHERRRQHGRHLAALGAAADQAVARVRDALDDDLSPEDSEQLLAEAHAAVDRHRRYADWLTRPIGPRSFAPRDWTARDRIGKAAKEALDSGVRRRVFAAALVANRELAAIELAEVEGREHPLPDGITVDDLRKGAEPVAKVKAKIAAVEKDIADHDTGGVTLYHSDRRALLKEKHRLQSLLTSGRP